MKDQSFRVLFIFSLLGSISSRYGSPVILLPTSGARNAGSQNGWKSSLLGTPTRQNLALCPHALTCDLRSLWSGLNKLKGVEIAISSIKSHKVVVLAKTKVESQHNLRAGRMKITLSSHACFLLNYLRLLSVRPLYCAGSSILIGVTTITMLLPRARNARFMLVKYFSPNLKNQILSHC